MGIVTRRMPLVSFMLAMVTAPLGIAGCQETDKLSPEMKEIAFKTLRYGDYYMNKYNDALKNEESDPVKYLAKGSELMVEQNGYSIEVKSKIVPLLSKKSAESTSECGRWVTSYSADYVILSATVQVDQSAMAHGRNDLITDKNDFKQNVEKYKKSRGEMIAKCDL